MFSIRLLLPVLAAVVLISPRAAGAQQFKPSFANCPAASSDIVIRCAQYSTAATCAADNDCGFCTARIASPIAAGAECTDAGSDNGGCTCEVPSSFSATPTATAAPEQGFCAPGTAKLPSTCTIDYSLSSGNSTCYSIRYGTGGCPTVSAAASIVPAWAALAALTIAVALVG
jgi:hypothetical protein